MHILKSVTRAGFMVDSAARVQVAAPVIVTAILTPLLTSWWYRRIEAAKQQTRGHS